MPKLSAKRLHWLKKCEGLNTRRTCKVSIRDISSSDNSSVSGENVSGENIEPLPIVRR